MKHLLILSIFSLFTLGLNAQVSTPQPSPSAELEFKVGLTDIEIEYSRPNKNDREIFGDLVPYGKIWRTGANKNTTIEFSDDVVVDGQTIKAGKYAIFTKPEKDNWEIYFYSDTENWGTPEKWDDKKVAAKTTAKAHKIPMVIETFSISIDDLTYDSAKLNFLWDNVYVETKIEVPTDKKVMASIDAAMKGSPTAQDYMAAANYYFTTEKDINQAKKWFDEGMKLTKEPKFWQFRQQSLIYAKSGDVKGAISLAQKSLDGAKAAGNSDYIKMNEESIKEWSKK
ncbi:DUF2911 domain-containing protein [Moheibacter lacus]|uniref:DUF2911 domain-containing protein n=1 Tax=Moheibacter lacus TaxID=2745851 RepID=A0A838ZPE2_9FLAO|nr:DUF2911 domain-containing protein [Moheibacter lacus]MBA5628675.1 DUF2911 domain-containing protein [Moheibacter lacus]